MFGSIVSLALEGARINALLVAAIELRLPALLESGPATVDELADRASISVRGCQAVADGMVALRLWEIADGRYRNSALARRQLVPGQPDYVGDEHPDLFRSWIPAYERVSELVRSGAPAHRIDSAETQRFWSLLTPMLARKGRRVAEHAIDLLDLQQPKPRLLDIGGGGGAMYGMVLLDRYPDATVVQVDLPHVNAMARAAMSDAGLDGRFEARDGNLDSIDLGEAAFDVAVISHIAHLRSPASCVGLFRRVARALAADGRILLVDWVIQDGRTGPASALLFNLSMLLLTPEGRAYERGELACLLSVSGFAEPQLEPAEDWATIILARKV